jgi:site-specific DNA-methyltransferase (adenine-specific)
MNKEKENTSGTCGQNSQINNAADMIVAGGGAFTVSNSSAVITSNTTTNPMDNPVTFNRGNVTLVHGDTDIIYNGDCMDVLRAMSIESVNLVVTSPPYFGLREYGTETAGRELHPQQYIDNLLKVFSEVKRVLKHDGSMYIVIGDCYFGTKGFCRNKGKYKRKTDQHYQHHKIAPEDGKWLQHKQLLMLPSRLTIGMQDAGWILRNDIIWEKTNPLPVTAKDRRLPVYEHILLFAKTKKYYYDRHTAKALGHHRDVITTSVERFNGHPASFPEKLIEPLLFISSRPGDVVLDPFLGGGTVAVVAKRYARKYVGIELNKTYADLAQTRTDSTVVLTHYPATQVPQTLSNSTLWTNVTDGGKK